MTSMINMDAMGNGMEIGALIGVLELLVIGIGLALHEWYGKRHPGMDENTQQNCHASSLLQ